MKVRNLLAAALVAALVVLGSFPGAATAQSGTTSATAFVLQNLGDQAANAMVEFRGADGGVTKTYGGLSIGIGQSINMDQRYATGDPGANPFTGSAVVSADQPLGSVVNIMRSPTAGSSAVPSYEAYNGLADANTGTTMQVLQVLKNVSSGGLVYNTTMAIQNTDPLQQTSVTVTFIPDPSFAGNIGSSVSKVYTVAGGSTLFLDQSTQTDPNIGSVFFGSAKVESNPAKVAVVTTSDGGGRQLLAYPSFAAGTTTPIGLPSVYKNVVSLGDSYSTAFLIANLGGSDATVDVTYYPSGGGAPLGPDSVTIPMNSVKAVDQRYAPALNGLSSFFGAAVVTPTNGVPVAVMVNLRGGSRFAMTYGGLTSGVAAGAKMFMPVAYKNIASGGYSWSSSIVFYAFAAGTTVKISYLDSRTGKPSFDSGTTPIPVTTGTALDLRYDASTNGHPDFMGAVVIEVVSGQLGAVVQTRGSGGSGDSLMSYQGLSK